MQPTPMQEVFASRTAFECDLRGYALGHLLSCCAHPAHPVACLLALFTAKQ